MGRIRQKSERQLPLVDVQHTSDGREGAIRHEDDIHSSKITTEISDDLPAIAQQVAQDMCGAKQSDEDNCQAFAQGKLKSEIHDESDGPITPGFDLRHLSSQGREIALARMQALDFGRRLVEEYKEPDALCQDSQGQNAADDLRIHYVSLCQGRHPEKMSSAEVESFLENGKNIPFLLHALVCHFPWCALDIYHTYYARDNDKLLSYRDINNNPIMKDMYLSWGADSTAFAGVTVINWYLSEQ